MAEYYKGGKEKNGNAFVEEIKNFTDWTVFYAGKLPKRWKWTILMPLIQKAMEIEDHVIAGNSIYVNMKESDEEIIRALESRVEEFQKAYRIFNEYDRAFERMMRNTDLIKDEYQRIREILWRIIRREMENDPEVSHIDIKVNAGFNDMTYTSLNGKQMHHYGLTSKNKEHWIDVELNAKELLRERIEKDRAIIASIRKRSASNT